LGIIALFLVLVYGLASLVTMNAGAFTPTERCPLIWFLVIFPVIVLFVFAWLVSCHSGKLFSPSDFKDEENYVKMQHKQFAAVASLAVASAQDPKGDQFDVDKVIQTVQQSSLKAFQDHSWRSRILWVDDRPDNNTHVREAFENMGLNVTISLNTADALNKIQNQKYAVIISDMGRVEGPREGYVLLDALRERGNKIPFFIYAGSNTPEHKKETEQHGGQGCTNSASEIFQMVMRAIVSI
jgi:CheY-like chemotaxis protein